MEWIKITQAGYEGRQRLSDFLSGGPLENVQRDGSGLVQVAWRNSENQPLRVTIGWADGNGDLYKLEDDVAFEDSAKYWKPLSEPPKE